MMEPIPEIISGRLGPKKFDENHCNPANEPPATNTAGNTSPSLLNPAIKTTRYSGTKKDKIGKIKQPESKYRDFGIFGLGYLPGSSCIVSIFRLQNTTKENFIMRLKKICIHEIGHNMGLPHCKSSENCVMKDAAESIKTIDKVNLSFCEACIARMN